MEVGRLADDVPRAFEYERADCHVLGEMSISRLVEESGLFNAGTGGNREESVFGDSEMLDLA